MESLIKNPGLKHLAENIFLYLDYEDIINCQIVSESWNGFLENPMFWLKKWTRKGLSKKNKIDWIKAINLSREDIKIEHNIVSYMKKIMEKKICQDIPCYINEKSVEKFLKSEEILGSIQLLAPKNSDEGLCKNILLAVIWNSNKLVKILAPLVKDPNIPSSNGITPIWLAAAKGYTEIVKNLAPLSEYPNTPNPEGVTPIQMARKLGYQDIVQVLRPFEVNEETQRRKNNADKQLQDIKLLFGFFSMLFMFMLFIILFVFSLEKYF